MIGADAPGHPDPALDRRALQRRLRGALALAGAMLVTEVLGGLLTNSLALLADAGHVLGDAGSVALALGAFSLAARPASARRTFGWYRVEILAALINGVTLFILAAGIGWLAIARVGEEPEIAGPAMTAIAAVGLAANIAGVIILHPGQGRNLNIRGAYYHVLGDTAGSIGALTAGAVIVLWGWTPVDLIASLLIAALLLISGVRLLRDASMVLLEFAPPHIDAAAAAEEVRRVPGVLGIHDLHLWTVTSGFTALSCHIEIAAAEEAEPILLQAAARLQERFGLSHVTLQPETAALHAQMACCAFPDQPADIRARVAHHHPPGA